ncbi:MAG: hypothetical protein QJR08_10320 [Bacillota bacterium]|nr:hypothetical protein [Bacillota bacterium]
MTTEAAEALEAEMGALLARLAAHGPWRRGAAREPASLEATGGGKGALPVVRLSSPERAVGWRFEGSAASLLLQAAMDRGADLLAALDASLEPVRRALPPGEEGSRGGRPRRGASPAPLHLRLALETSAGAAGVARPGATPRLHLLLPLAPSRGEGEAGPRLAAGGAAALLRGWAQGGALVEGRRLEVALVQPRAPAAEPPERLAAAAEVWLAEAGWLGLALGSARRAPAHRSVR